MGNFVRSIVYRMNQIFKEMLKLRMFGVFGLRFKCFAAILEYKFYIIGFEYMVEVDSGPTSEFMPIEVGLVEWSMREGVTDSLHKFINPGSVLLVQ
jgi:hypothetical protein